MSATAPLSAASTFQDIAWSLGKGFSSTKRNDKNDDILGEWDEGVYSKILRLLMFYWTNYAQDCQAYGQFV